MEKPKLNFTINGTQNMDVLFGPRASFEDQTGKLLNGGEIFTVVTEYGDMLFQNVKTPFGMISLSMYDIHHEAEIAAQSADSGIEFMFMMLGNASFKLEGLDEISMRQKDCSLIYFPYVKNKVKFPAGTKIMTVDLHLSPEYLIDLLPYFGNLGSFLEKVYKNEAVGLFKLPISIPRNVISIIAHLFMETGTQTRQELYLKRKIVDWIASPLESPFVHKKVKVTLTSAEKEQIIEVYKEMLDFSDNPLTIPDLAKRAGMNEFKFKYGFKEIFYGPPHEILVAERMKKALELLGDNNYNISSIAYHLGYQDVAAFSKAFKKMTGYSPSVFRSNGLDNPESLT